MSYRDRLPQLDGGLFLTDGGIETVLIFHEGLDLPAFAAFDLLKDDAGTRALRRHYDPYASLAREHGLGFVLESPTWRRARAGRPRSATPSWSSRKAIALMEEIRDEYADVAPVVISGCVGPHDDGYRPGEILSADAAHDYHRTQIATFADTAADMVTAITMTYADRGVLRHRPSPHRGDPRRLARRLRGPPAATPWQRGERGGAALRAW